MAVLMRVYADVRILDIPLPGTLSYSYGLNSSLQFSGVLPENWPNAELVEVGQQVDIFIEKTRLLTGIIQRLEPSMNLTQAFSGVGLLDAAYDEKVFPLAYYVEQPLLGVLCELLLQAGWILGDISTLDTPDQETTIDIRSEANLLTQINKLLNGVPGVFYREGETILGYPSLDIGSFLTASSISALPPFVGPMTPRDNPFIHWVKELKYQEDQSEAVYAVRALGGNVKDNNGVSRTINLGDALSADNTLAYDPDFPIIEDLAEYNWVSLNLAEFGSVGGRIIAAVTNNTATGGIGDFAGGASEQNNWIMQTFIPFPGILESFSLKFASVDAAALGFDVTWVLQEISPSNFLTVIADNLLTGTFSTTGLANSIKKIIPDTEYELEAGKLYGIAIGFNFNPPTDIFRVFVNYRTISLSSIYRLQFLTSGKGTVGTPWSALNAIMFMEVITSPVEPVYAGLVGQTAAKYAPKSTGANSTLADIRAAGTALYQWTKAFLSDRILNIKEFSLNAEGSQNFPKAGDTIFVNSKASSQYIDPLTGRITQTQREIIGDLRIDNVQASIVGDKIDLNYKLINGIGVLRTDLIVDLYDKTENEAPAEGDSPLRPWLLLLDTLSVVVGPVVPDSEMSDGTLAVRVTLSIFDGLYASRPNDVEEVYLTGLPYGTISPGGTLRVEMIQLPTIENAEVIFDIALNTRDWEYGDVATITVKQVWR